MPRQKCEGSGQPPEKFGFSQMYGYCAVCGAQHQTTLTGRIFAHKKPLVREPAAKQQPAADAPPWSEEES